MGLIDKITAANSLHGLFSPGDTVIVAVSGGPDSVALLDCLAQIENHSLRLIVAHLNHSLRGEESEKDEAFVRNLAENYGIPIECRKVDVSQLSCREGLSIEEAGRMARYEYFSELAGHFGANAVALAHHADDQAETLLLRLLRGAGSKGLAGMRARNGIYIRPFLAVSKSEILEYLQQQGIGYRIDQSNRNTDFLRNRIRHELMPLLADYNPSIVARLNATAEVLSAEDIFMDNLTADKFNALAEICGERVVLPVNELRKEDSAIRLRLFRHAISRVKGDMRHLSYQHILAIDRLLNSQYPNSRLTLPVSTSVIRAYDKLIFGRSEESSRKPYAFQITGEGEYPVPGGGVVEVKLLARPILPTNTDGNVEFFSISSAPFPWVVRTFQAGDRFSPYGMAGSKKIKKLFIDEKIPISDRERIPLVFCGQSLIWVAGVRRAASAPVTGVDEVVARVELRDFTP